jgi:hypothetical protein
MNTTVAVPKLKLRVVLSVIHGFLLFSNIYFRAGKFAKTVVASEKTEEHPVTNTIYNTHRNAYRILESQGVAR